MNITPIGCNQQNSQQNFTGYIGKDVLKIINTASQNSIKSEINLANNSNKLIDIEDIRRIKKLTEKVINKLDNFVKNLHKDTYLTIDESNKYLILKNKKLGTTYFLGDTSTPIITPYERDNGNNIYQERLSESTLWKIDNFAKTLNKENPKELDKKMFEQFTDKLIVGFSAIGKFISRRRAKKADRLASEFGGEGGGWLDTVTQKITEYETDKKMNKILTKDIQRKNKEIAKMYLK